MQPLTPPPVMDPIDLIVAKLREMVNGFFLWLPDMLGGLFSCSSPGSASISLRAALDTYRVLEARAGAPADGWSVAVVPPSLPLPLPKFAFAYRADMLDGAARVAVTTSAWAARRWNVPALAVPGLASREPPFRPTLAQRRAASIAAALRADGIPAVPPRRAGQRFALARPAAAS